DFGDIEPVQVAEAVAIEPPVPADEYQPAMWHETPADAAPETLAAEQQVDVVPESLADIQSDQGQKPGWAGREGLGDVARKVLWPQFVNQTSTLIDRAMEAENLFSRI